MNRKLFVLILLSAFPFLSECQIYIGFNKPDSTTVSKDSIIVSEVNTSVKPDAGQSDVPFIDYKPAVIWNSPTDSYKDYAYIRRNFTDQLVSVWNYPKRLYPASHIYAIDMDGKHYRAVKVSEQNYVFAEKMIEGEMDLYLFRKIPQVNGWIEVVGQDSAGKVYHNNMIVENKTTSGKQEYFGYFFSKGSDTLKPVSNATIKLFAETYLTNTPKAYSIANKFSSNSFNKSTKAAVIGLMSVGIIGLALTGGGGATWIFLAGFPAAALVAFLNRPQTLHWEDMMEIVSMYNEERGVEK